MKSFLLFPKSFFFKTIISLLFLLIFSYPGFAQLSGPKTIPGDYATIAAAVADLNAVGVGAGGVTFNVAAGYTENITAPIQVLATGTIGNPIVFQKSGGGANPLLTRTDVGSLSTSILGGQGDAVIIIDGGDYITFDGISVAASDAGIEYGYYLRKASVTDACKNVNIKNAAITMFKAASAYVIGLYVSNNDAASLVSSAAGITVTSTGGRHENVTITGNTISNVFSGIFLRGFAASTPYDFYDQNITIGQSGAGNTIQNFAGNAAVTAYGVYTLYQANTTISYNVIDNAGGGGANATSTIYGVFVSTSSAPGAIVVNNNAITIGQSATSAAHCIYISPGTAATSITANNNIFSYGTFASTTASYILYANTATNDVTISGNQTSGAINKTGAGAFYCYYNLGSPTGGTETLTNNNFSNITVTGTSALYGIYSNTAVAQNRVCSGNTVSGFTNGTGTLYTIYATSALSNQVFNNNIYNITSGGTVYGLYFTGTNPTVYGNTVHDMTTTGTAMYGIYNAGTGTTNCYNNRVYGLTTSAASPSLYGLYITTGTNNYSYNNFISDLNATAGSGAISIAGIYVSGGTSIGLFFNTVFLKATSSSGTFGSAGVYASTTPTLEMRNNIIVNLSVPGNGSYLAKTVAFKRSTASLTTYSSASNNNLLYAGTPDSSHVIYFDNGSTLADQSLSAYKGRVSPRDNSSFTENPPFINTVTTPYNLHISTSIATQIESGGSAVSTPSITTDFDGDTRNATPDVGADEGNFIITDLTGPAIAYTTLGNTSLTSNRTLSPVTITDFSGVNTTSGTRPRIYFKRLTDANTFNDNTSSTDGWKWVQATESSSPFSFVINYALLNGGTGVATGNTVQYFVVAQDLAGTPNVSISSGTFASTPTSVNLTAAQFPITDAINSYFIATAYTGTYTVGNNVAYNFLTLKDAFDAINANSMTGNVTLSIQTEGTTEAATAVLNTLSYDGGPFTLTIKPASGTFPVITGSIAGSIIKLNGADNVIIDGSNTVSGTSRDLTISNTSTSASAAIWLSSVATGNGAANNIIKNCNIACGATQNTGTTTTFGIFSGGATIGITIGGADNDNNTYTNNYITKSRYGIFSIGASSANANTSTMINLNLVGPAAFGVDEIGKGGIILCNETNATITQNEVRFVGGDYLNTSSGTDRVGIGFATDAAWAPTAAFITNSSITRNLIHDIVEERTFSVAGIALAGTDGTNNTNNTVANNMLYNLKANGTSGDQAIGIGVTSGKGDVVAFNSIYLTGDTDPSVGSTTPTTSNFGLSLSSTTPTNLTLKDNIIYMDLSSSSAPALKNAAINIPASYTWGTGVSDYNDLFILIANVQSNIGCVGGSGGTFATDIAAWRIASTQDANSVSQDPIFNSATDLHLNTTVTPMFLAGVPVTGILTDYDGDTRNVGQPYMGADEDPAKPLPVELSAFTAVSNGKSVTLKWETATELNANKFVVERSVDTKLWTAIGEVRAHGNSNKVNNYSFEDNKVGTGTYSYRLRVIDFDGTFTISKTAVAEVEVPRAYALSQNYPNPFNPTTRIDYQLPVDARVTIELFSITGEKVAELINNEQSAGYYTLDVNSSSLHKNLASGVYIYRMNAVDKVNGNNFVNIKKMVMLK